MTSVSAISVKSDRIPDAISYRKGELGGYILEATFGSEIRRAGFTKASEVMAAFASLTNPPVQAKAKRAKKVGNVPTIAAEPVAGTSTAPAPDAPTAKKRGRPKGSKNKAALNGSEDLAAQAA
jgi:hypothetical protein